MSNFTLQTRAGGNRLLRPLCSTKLYENNFFNRCVSSWNFLPHTLVDASSILCFKRLLSNVDLSTFTYCTYFNNVYGTSVSGDYVALLYDVPKFTCNVVFVCHYLCLLHVT